jgi:hypothetical protein
MIHSGHAFKILSPMFHDACAIELVFSFNFMTAQDVCNDVMQIGKLLGVDVIS